MDKIPERLNQDIDNFISSNPTIPDQLDLLFNFVTTQSNLPYLILDKISKSGYESLSKREKEILFKASKD
jgi:hypothetical protein